LDIPIYAGLEGDLRDRQLLEGAVLLWVVQHQRFTIACSGVEQHTRLHCWERVFTQRKVEYGDDMIERDMSAPLMLRKATQKYTDAEAEYEDLIIVEELL
jgi:hypothetical protein